MGDTYRFAVASDVHYACDIEKARGNDYEQRTIANPLLRVFVHYYRRFFWARDPFARNYLLDDFIAATDVDHAVICGDLTCDTGFVGASDLAAFQSADECLKKLRARFRHGVDVIYGDHDLGKVTFFGGAGGMRLDSLDIMRNRLGCPEFWTRNIGDYVLIGVSSSLVAFPSFEAEALPDERERWTALRAEHIAAISQAFEGLPARAKVILFCHDPTALPYLHEVPSVRARLPQIECTFIGHLHSRLILAKSRLLAGMPTIRFLGHTVAKLSKALGRARLWKPFNVILCPALAGIELLKDGGFCEVELDPSGSAPLRVITRRLPRRNG
jgi:hypothetical protein